MDTFIWTNVASGCALMLKKSRIPIGRYAVVVSRLGPGGPHTSTTDRLFGG
jgi:hypothetical protein